jgi:hypothetical protein
MRANHQVPWLPLDALKMGLHLGAPPLGVHPEDDDLETPDRRWPVIKGLLENLIYDGRDYLVEGINLRPTGIMAQTPQGLFSGPSVRTCPSSPRVCSETFRC